MTPRISSEACSKLLARTSVIASLHIVTTRLLVLFLLGAAALSSTSAYAVRRHGKVRGAAHHAPAAPARPSAAPAAPKYHSKFAGNGTGGDSPKVEGGGPELLLTFDDGPAPGKTEKVLDLLDQHGYKAVFFVCGVHFQGKGVAQDRARALLRETVRRGHAVGNHTIHHLFLCNKSGGSKIEDEVQGNGQLIAEALGEPPYLFRTPYGAHCKNLDETLQQIGVRPIGWDIDPQDWRLKNAPKIEASVKASLRSLNGRAILLLHDVQAATISALPNILNYIDEENTRRSKVGQPPIKVISYDYLMEGRPSKTPLLDALAQLANDLAQKALPLLGQPGPATAPTPAKPAPAP